MVNNIQYPANYDGVSDKENANFPKGEKKSLSNSRGNNQSSSNLKEFGKDISSKNNQNEENSTFGFYKVFISNFKFIE